MTKAERLAEARARRDKAKVEWRKAIAKGDKTAAELHKAVAKLEKAYAEIWTIEEAPDDKG